MAAKFIPNGLGWIPDLPDPRDYTWRHKEILPLLQQLKPISPEVLPDEVDLRSGDEGELFFTDVEDQLCLNSSCSFAALSLFEYFQRRIHGRTFDGSKLFLYKVARNLRTKRCTATGDTGADLRSTLKAFRRFGVPEEEYWPYQVERFDEEPSAFIYQVARSRESLRYFRIEDLSESTSDNFVKTRWDQLTSFLAAGFPVAFGFSVPSSLSSDSNVPYRPDFDEIRGGQAVLAVGYKFGQYGPNQHGLLIRNSWGQEWGGNGYGSIPAAFVTAGTASNFWTVFDPSWVASNELSSPV